MASWRSGLSDKTQNKITYFTYDARGGLTGVVKSGIADSSGVDVTTQGYSHTVFVHDQAGKLLATYTAPHQSEVFVYDGMGRTIEATNVAGATTTITFGDAARTTTSVTTGSGYTVVATYNKAGDLISSVDFGIEHGRRDGRLSLRQERPSAPRHQCDGR